MTDILGLAILLLVGLGAITVLFTGLLVNGARRPPVRAMAYALAHGLPCDPAGLGLEFEAWTLDRPGGVLLPVWEINGGDASGPTVIMVHGWGQSRIDMLGRVGPWTNRAARLLLYDLRGHGEAEGGPSPLGVGEEGDLLTLIERSGAERVVVVGWSMGAAIALHAAAADGPVASRIEGVIGYGTYDSFADALEARLRAAALPTRPFTWLANLWFRLRGVRHVATGRVAGSVGCSVLLVHGEDDPIVPVAVAETLATRLPRGELHVVAGAGHVDAHTTDDAGNHAVIGRFVSSAGS